MPCYHPLKRFIIRDSLGEIFDGKVTSYDADGIVRRGESWVPFQGDQHYYGCQTSREYQVIGCGQCIGCRVSHAKDWATRMMLESLYHEESYFLTLTYDDLHLHRRQGCHPETGEVIESATLCKDDVQKFMKRLRYYAGEDKLRYYLCGEYGGHTLRPHYHAVIFGLHLDPSMMRVYRIKDGYPLYNHPLLDRAWSDDDGLIGWIVAGSVSFESAGYVARYATKKLMSGYKEVYDALNVEPEFSLMSRRPGLGRQWYEDHAGEAYENDEIFLQLERGGRRVKPPRYYDNLFDVDYPDRMEEVKELRVRTAQACVDAKLLHTNLSYLDLLKSQEAYDWKRMESKLERSGI